MACDEQAEAIFEIVEALANEGIVTNMDEVEKEFSISEDLKELGLTRAEIARAIVEVQAWRASQAVNRTISNLSEIKGEANIEEKLRAKIDALQSELGTVPVDSPVGPRKKKRINQTIEALRKELEEIERAKGLDKKYLKRLKDLNKSIEKLDKQIADLEEGRDVVREARTPKEEAEAIEKLKQTRKERTRERDLLEQINRNIKGETVEKPPEDEPAPLSPRIAELTKMRDETATRRRLLNQIKDLQKRLQTGEYQLPMRRKARDESAEVEALRAKKRLLQKQMATAVRSLERRPGTAQWWTENIMGAYKTSRASIDWSMILRQGYKYLLAHPMKSSWKLPGTAKATVSEEYFQDAFNQIIHSPEHYIMQKGGLELTDPDGMLGEREDMFAQTGWLENSFITNTLLVGKAIRASNRAYTHYLNQIRVQAYMDLVRGLSINGKLPPTEDLKAVGRFVNVITGRGDPGPDGRGLRQYGELLNNLMFSYRFTLSQFQFMEDGLRLGLAELGVSNAAMPTDFVTQARKEGQNLQGSKMARRAILKEYARIATGMQAMTVLGAMWNLSQVLWAPGFDDDDEKELKIIASGVFGPDGKRKPMKFKTDKEVMELAGVILKTPAFNPNRFPNENDKKYRIRRENEAARIAAHLAGKGPVYNDVTIDDVVSAVKEYSQGEKVKDYFPTHEDGYPLYLDPRSTEYQKWRVGDRRVDMMGGFQQAVTLVSRFLPHAWGGGKVTINRKGEVENTGQWSAHQGPRTAWQWFSNKLHPLISATGEYVWGEQDYTDRPTRKKDAEGLEAWEPNWEWVADEFIPFWNSLFVQDAREIVKHEGMTKDQWEYVGFLIGTAFIGSGSFVPNDDRSGEEGTYVIGDAIESAKKMVGPPEKEPPAGKPGRR